jgi:hypothetical protein
MILGMTKVGGILKKKNQNYREYPGYQNVRTPRCLLSTHPARKHERPESRYRHFSMPGPQQKDIMKTATAAIAVPIHISVQRSLLAAEVVVL